MSQVLQELRQYLSSKQAPPSSDEQLHTGLLTLLKEKDSQLQNMQADLTKHRCQLLRTNKQLKQLQEKCSMGVSNGNNTSSTFMLPGEFKSKFESFMKNTVSSAFVDIMHRPKSCAVLLQRTLEVQYERADAQLSSILNEVAAALKLENTPSVRKALFAQLLKTLQEGHERLFQIPENDTVETLRNIFAEDEQLLGVVNNSEFKQLLSQLNQLLAYMLLQEGRWEFVYAQQRIVEFSSKCMCVQGRMKDQEKAVMLLEGIKRPAPNGGYNVHPSLKNFVLPYRDETELTPKTKKIEVVSPKISKKPAEEKVEKTVKQLSRVATVDIRVVSSAPVPPAPERQIIVQPQLERKTDRSVIDHPSTSLSVNQPVPPAVRMKELLESLPLKRSELHPDCKKKKSGASKIAGLLTDPSFSEELVAKRPHKRQESSTRLMESDYDHQIINRQHRTTTALDRKSIPLKKEQSVGRIIHQLSKLSLKDEPAVVTTTNSHGQFHSRCQSNKENHNNHNGKEAGYREIILSKFRQEKGPLKAKQPRKQLNLFSDMFVAKTDRQQDSRKRQQNRPLKPSAEHMQRVRQKHYLLF